MASKKKKKEDLNENEDIHVWKKDDDQIIDVELNPNGPDKLTVHHVGIKTEDGYSDYAVSYDENTNAFVNFSTDTIDALRNAYAIVDENTAYVRKAVSDKHDNYDKFFLEQERSRAEQKVEELREEINKMRNDMATLIDLKIKVLPPLSTGIYLVEFDQKTTNKQLTKIMNLLRENVNKRFNNDSILLVGIRKIEDISDDYEKVIDKEIERLIQLKKELSDAK